MMRSYGAPSRHNARSQRMTFVGPRYRVDYASIVASAAFLVPDSTNPVLSVEDQQVRISEVLDPALLKNWGTWQVLYREARVERVYVRIDFDFDPRKWEKETSGSHSLVSHNPIGVLAPDPYALKNSFSRATLTELRERGWKHKLIGRSLFLSYRPTCQRPTYAIPGGTDFNYASAPSPWFDTIAPASYPRLYGHTGFIGFDGAVIPEFTWPLGLGFTYSVQARVSFRNPIIQ